MMHHGIREVGLSSLCCWHPTGKTGPQKARTSLGGWSLCFPFSSG